MKNKSLASALGLEIWSLRRTKNMSQQGLADKTGLSRNIISMIERGKSDPKLSTLNSIYGALGFKMSVELK